MSQVAGPYDHPYGHLSMESQARRARNLAHVVHAGQKDKAGADYAGHCDRVARYFRERALEAGVRHLNVGVVAAYLHDSVEDTPMTMEMLRVVLGIPHPALRIIDLLTYDGKDRGAYYSRIAKHPLASLVKAADMDDNSDPKRLALLDPIVAARLEMKYEKGYRMIGVRSRWAT